MQLDLFTERCEPTLAVPFPRARTAARKRLGKKAIVFSFPLARRRGLVTQIATKLACSSYDEGRAFWDQHVRAMRKELKASGLSPSSIAQEIERYTKAVAHETIVISQYRHRQPEDAA